MRLKRTRQVRDAVVLVLILIPATTVVAQPRTDVVRLANGDHITGEVVVLERGRLEFKTDDAGTIYFEWDNVAHVEATRQFEIATTDGRGRGQLRSADGGQSDPDIHDRFIPTVYLYDNYPGGVGQSEPLWRRQHGLVRHARELVEGCDCKAGCPACVGPVLELQESLVDSPRALALRVLQALEAA